MSVSKLHFICLKKHPDDIYWHLFKLISFYKTLKVSNKLIIITEQHADSSVFLSLELNNHTIHCVTSRAVWPAREKPEVDWVQVYLQNKSSW